MHAPFSSSFAISFSSCDHSALVRSVGPARKLASPVYSLKFSDTKRATSTSTAGAGAGLRLVAAAGLPAAAEGARAGSAAALLKPRKLVVLEDKLAENDLRS
jgi:hypothetical protein